MSYTLSGTIKASRKNESYVLTSMGHKRLITVPLSHQTIESLLLTSRPFCSKRQQATALTKNIIVLYEKHCICSNPLDAGRKVCFSCLKSGGWSAKVTTNINSNGFWRYTYTYSNRISEISPLLSTTKLLLGTLKNLPSRWMWWTSGNTSLFHVQTAFGAWRVSYWHTEQFSRTEDYLWRF